MIGSGPVLSPKTGRPMKKAGTALRIVREQDGETYYIRIRIYFDEDNHEYHRALPAFLLPFKHYIREIIQASREEDPDLDLYDYPSDSSRLRWMTIGEADLLPYIKHKWKPGFTHKPACRLQTTLIFT